MIVSANTPVPVLSMVANDDSTGSVFNGLIHPKNFVDKNGTFNVSIPIFASLGRNGMQPKVSPAHNSQSRDGIGRCTASMVRDSYSSDIQRDDDFKFCMDGRRLVQISEREYRTEQEFFSRIKSYGDTEMYPDSGVVEYSNGSVATYGQTTLLTLYRALGNA